jgi:hypothetical protein
MHSADTESSIHKDSSHASRRPGRCLLWLKAGAGAGRDTHGSAGDSPVVKCSTYPAFLPLAWTRFVGETEDYRHYICKNPTTLIECVVVALLGASLVTTPNGSNDVEGDERQPIRKDLQAALLMKLFSFNRPH